GARRRAELSPGGAGLRDQHDQCLARSRHALQGAGRRMGGGFSGRAGGAGAGVLFAVLGRESFSHLCEKERPPPHSTSKKQARRSVQAEFVLERFFPKAVAGFVSERFYTPFTRQPE